MQIWSNRRMRYLLCSANAWTMNALILALCVWSQVAVGQPVGATPPRDTTLLHQSDLSYLGAFRVPQGEIGQSTFAYGGSAPAFNPANNSLFLVGFETGQAVAEISIPPLVNSSNKNEMNTAAVLQPFRTVQPRVSDWTLEGESRIGGLQVVDNQLVGTFYEYYDANGNAVDSHFKLSTLDLANASVSGLHQVGTHGAGSVAGFMTPVPLEWQAELGMPYLTGQAGINITSRTSAGPAAFGFDPHALSNSTTPAINYLSYPLDHPLAPFSTKNPIYNQTTEISGVVFPPNSGSVIFFGSHGTGAYCYGDPGPCNDPVRNYKGNHSVGGLYEYQAWAYNVEDLIDVKNGLKQSWQIQPYDVWTFDLPTPEPQKHLGGVAFDAQSGRLYVSQLRGDQVGYDPLPIIHVFQLPISATGRLKTLSSAVPGG